MTPPLWSRCLEPLAHAGLRATAIGLHGRASACRREHQPALAISSRHQPASTHNQPASKPASAISSWHQTSSAGVGLLLATRSACIGNFPSLSAGSTRVLRSTSRVKPRCGAFAWRGRRPASQLRPQRPPAMRANACETRRGPKVMCVGVARSRIMRCSSQGCVGYSLGITTRWIDTHWYRFLGMLGSCDKYRAL